MAFRASPPGGTVTVSIEADGATTLRIVNDEYWHHRGQLYLMLGMLDIVLDDQLPDTHREHLEISKGCANTLLALLAAAAQ